MSEIDHFLGIKQQKLGIPWCINCIGMHPEDELTVMDLFERLQSPQKRVFRQLLKQGKVIGSYINKSCMMCGRTYDSQGHCKESETWTLTAQRIKQELDAAGIFGVDDKKIDSIVATCRKNSQVLLRNRNLVAEGIRQWRETGDKDLITRCDRMTFAGCLAHIITVAQASRVKKLNILNCPVTL